jgi:hypothetical protein
MFKRLAVLSVILVLVALAAGSGHPRAQGSDITPAATMSLMGTASAEPTAEATQQTLENLPGGLMLKPVTTEENTTQPKFSVKVTKPVLSGGTGAVVDNFNKAVDSLVDETVSQFKKDFGTTGDGVATLPSEIEELGSYVEMTYELFDTHMSLISVKVNVYWYGAGAAHPNSYSRTLNYDLEHGNVLELADLFKPDAKYLEALSAYSVKTLKAMERLDFPEGAEPKPENYQSWNITEQGLRINFDDYQVTPHAVGPQVVVIPFEKLKDVIRTDGPLALFLKSG